MRFASTSATLLLLGCTPTDAVVPVDDTDDSALVDDTDVADTDDTPPEPADPRDLPVLLVHGINGEAANYDVVVERLIESGWPADAIYAHTFEDPAWGCNVDNAAAIAGWVDAILVDSGEDRVHLVAHSMGVLSSRYYLKHLGGTAKVNTYATLGGMHHGLTSSCSPDFPFKPCVWDEICATGSYVADLNAAPATPGPLHWISIYGTGDDTVPNASSQLDGAEWIEMPGVEHAGEAGLLEDAATFVELERVLRYDVIETP